MHQFLKMHILLKEYVFPYGKTDRHGDLYSPFIVGKKEKRWCGNRSSPSRKLVFEDQDWKFYTMSFAKYIWKQFGKDSGNKRHSSIPFGIEASENKLGLYVTQLKSKF